MEMLTMICEKLWIVMMLAAFFICLAKGWLRKGFYITREQGEENEYREKLEKEILEPLLLSYARKKVPVACHTDWIVSAE